MKSITLGTSSLQVSRLAYGCWRIAGTQDPARVKPADEAAGRKAVIAALDAGFTLFDLADIYCGGASEKVFGQALRQVHGMRDRVVISTKCGIRKSGDPVPDAPYRYDFSASYIIWSCERSLKRLGVDAIDLYLLHRPDYLMEPEEVAAAFSKLKRQGKVREFGVSNFKPSQVALLQKSCPMNLHANQVEFSLVHRDPLTDGTLDQCHAIKLTLMAWSPLGGGVLASGARELLQHQKGYKAKKVVAELDRLAKTHNTTRANVALAWLLRHPAGVVPIVGSADPARIREAATAGKVELSREEWYRLLAVASPGPLP
ncbi:MAG: aldo/keto reductase [Rhodobacteraceae bacterium]|nr:aldo/keto reductase [Paracoccaceae bacterium]